MSTRRLDALAENAFFEGVENAGRFFMGKAQVHKALLKLVRLLEDEDIDYAIIGAMALNEYGYHRVTDYIDVLLSREGLQEFKRLHLGRGYVEKFPGSKGMRDTEHNVPVDVVLAGEYPGDGQPKSVVFPDPSTTAARGKRVRLLPLDTLIELKLASGLTAAHRLRDLADVLEIIKVRGLDSGFADELDPLVQDKYRELWQAAQTIDPE